MQAPHSPKRIVTIQVSSTISAQGTFIGFDESGKAQVDIGGKIRRGKLVSKLAELETA